MCPRLAWRTSPPQSLPSRRRALPTRLNISFLKITILFSTDLHPPAVERRKPIAHASGDCRITVIMDNVRVSAGYSTPPLVPQWDVQPNAQAYIPRSTIGRRYAPATIDREQNGNKCGRNGNKIRRKAAETVELRCSRRGHRPICNETNGLRSSPMPTGVGWLGLFAGLMG